MKVKKERRGLVTPFAANSAKIPYFHNEPLAKCLNRQKSKICHIGYFDVALSNDTAAAGSTEGGTPSTEVEKWRS